MSGPHPETLHESTLDLPNTAGAGHGYRGAPTPLYRRRDADGGCNEVWRPGRYQQDAGLKLKAPFIDTVNYFDKRLLLFDAPPDSLLTGDKKRLIIDVYARGRIVDPLLFFERLRTESQASTRAVGIISSELRTEVAGDNQAEIITTKRQDIMSQVKDNVSPKLLEFGIEVVDLRIKRADFPNEIADSVYARMQAERKRIADRERAEGAEVDAGSGRTSTSRRPSYGHRRSATET